MREYQYFSTSITQRVINAGARTLPTNFLPASKPPATVSPGSGVQAATVLPSSDVFRVDELLLKTLSTQHEATAVAWIHRNTPQQFASGEIEYAHFDDKGAV